MLPPPRMYFEQGASMAELQITICSARRRKTILNLAKHVRSTRVNFQLHKLIRQVIKL